MGIKTALLGGLLIAGHASAKINAIFSPSEDIESILRRDADSVFADLARRQNPSSTASAPQISTTPASGDPAKADLADWEATTKAACGTALSSLKGQASNPTGLAVCYNVPFLNNSTGVFQAELRMYNVSAPINPWVGVNARDISMTLSYLGATVQAMNGTLSRRDAAVTWPPIREGFLDERLVERQNANEPQALKVLMYVGQINKDSMGTAMDTLKDLLIPQIQLTANSPSGAALSETLSGTEASFVNGVFAKQATTTQDAAARASATAALSGKGASYILPGTKLAFFPVGLVITCVWTGFFFLAVGLGTVGRMQFREQYRRRMKREIAQGVRTI
ncbi:hypothetical protein P154DRAFT_580983 [Amniculicola lignicola CBS 123094]|uniref:Uncharacterized protein n=1 Tax=Amniculicola lignicola CBS 123094 TaxID=1392246 RepID=A0A6A5W0M4_9PLEO|nr:hypothetical protein P154DRAFT_580983 [Amniculicola lignicola CBS 123094]